METLNKKKGIFHMPHTYALIVCFILLAFVMTFIIPSGAYDRVTNPETGVEMVDPETYHSVDAANLKPFDIALAIPKGLEQAGYIIFFIFIIAGAFQIVTATGAIEAGIKRLAVKLQGKEVLAIVMFMFVFSIGGATIGMSQETVIFIPIAIMLARSIGYDAIVGFAMVSLGAQVGFHSGWLNPFTVAVAQDVAELPLFSAIGMRLVFWVVYLVCTIWFVARYAKKVKNNPEKSIVRDLELREADQKLNLDNIEKMTKTQVVVLLTVLAALALLIVGISLWGWYITEMSCIVFSDGSSCRTYRKTFGVSRICDEFNRGCKDGSIREPACGSCTGNSGYFYRGTDNRYDSILSCKCRNGVAGEYCRYRNVHSADDNKLFH